MARLEKSRNGKRGRAINSLALGKAQMTEGTGECVQRVVRGGMVVRKDVAEENQS